MRSNLQRLCPPPRRFHPAGEVLSAEFVKPPSFVVPRRSRSQAHASGIRYERRVHEHLAETFPIQAVLGPWIKFTSRGRDSPLYCQPDALLLDLRGGTITVVEIKIKHTSDAWWQIRRLYAPVVEHIFGEGWTYIAIEIAKWFDPHTRFPEEFTFVDDLSSVTKLSSEAFYLHLWRGRK